MTEQNFYLVTMIRPVERSRYWVQAASFDEAADKAIRADETDDLKCGGVESVQLLSDGGAFLP